MIIEAKISRRLWCPPGGTVHGLERATTYSPGQSDQLGRSRAGPLLWLRAAAFDAHLKTGHVLAFISAIPGHRAVGDPGRGRRP